MIKNSVAPAAERRESGAMSKSRNNELVQFLSRIATKPIDIDELLFRHVRILLISGISNKSADERT